jgi:hypothetical protein
LWGREGGGRLLLVAVGSSSSSLKGDPSPLRLCCRGLGGVLLLVVARSSHVLVFVVCFRVFVGVSFVLVFVFLLMFFVVVYCV